MVDPRVVARQYREYLEEVPPFHLEARRADMDQKLPTDVEGDPGIVALSHSLWMTKNMPGGNTKKGHRWLGFIQGVLWANRLFTIDDLRHHNMNEEVTEDG